jgi:DNA-directed RNA polymerase specialized sigma24 family protein
VDQKSVIECQLKESNKRKKQKERIESLYETYISHGNESDFDELLKEMNAYCKPWVSAKLSEYKWLPNDTLSAVMQEGGCALWKIVNKDRQAFVQREKFVAYMFKIYKNKTHDEIRKALNEKKNYNVIYVDEPIGDDKKTLADSLSSKQIGEEIEREESRLFYDKMFILYCKALVTSTAFPPRCLALYYASILPHFTEAIKDSKTISAKWAYEKMGSRTIRELTTDSETTLCSIDSSLHWCEDFIQKLSEKITEKGITGLLGNMVYTTLYDKGKIEDWADTMRKATLKAAMNMIAKDGELSKLAKEHTEHMYRVRKMVEGGKRK